MKKNNIILKQVALKDILPLHEKIFLEKLSIKKVSERQKKGKLIFLHLLLQTKIVGYTIVQFRNNDCHIWIMGLLSPFRGKGLGSNSLHSIELFALNHKSKRVTISTFNHRKEMLALAIKNDFKIIGTEEGKYGDKVKIRLVKNLIPKREIRILLTNKCNFNCIFCHSEGLNAKENYKIPTAEKFIALLRKAVDNGYNDITFTGGEPLLKKDLLIKILKGLANFKFFPEITIVTNAVFLENDILNALAAYPGNLKLNISFHSQDKEQFDSITRTRNNYDVVYNNIKKAVAAGIKIKLNCVIMAGKNSEKKHILEYLKEAKKLGVFGVKFLELLVLPKNEFQFKYFISSRAITNQLIDLGAILIKENDRVKFLSYKKFPNLNIEVTRLTCKIGCAKCMSVRDKTFGPDLNYYPCFIHSEKPIVLNTPEDLPSAFQAGEKQIAKYAEKFGADSPILIKQDKYVKSRVSAFFSIGVPKEEASEILEKFGFSIAKKRAFKLYYVCPQNPGADWLVGNKALKYGFDKHSPNIVEFIYSKFYKVLFENIVCWRQEFINNIPPPTCKSIEQAQEIMDALSFKNYMCLDFNLTEYSKNNINVSVDDSNLVGNIKIDMNFLKDNDIKKLLIELKAENITKPHHLWLKEKLMIIKRQS